MANGFIIRSKDKLQEISIKLDQSHLVYLQMDASPEKLEQRRKVEGKENHRPSVFDLHIFV